MPHPLATVDTRSARLPVNYQHAREALAQCEQVDECKDWADKAAALASYAKQADDESLFKTAMRIKGRAVQRVGQLVKEIEEGQRGRPPVVTPTPQPPPRPRPPENGRTDAPILPKPQGRFEVAAAAGISRDQAKRAIAVASIPAEEFEALIEADDPPTVNELVERGREIRRQDRAPSPPPKPEPPAYLQGHTPAEFNAAIHARGRVRDLADQCPRVTPAVVAHTTVAAELPALLAQVRAVAAWVGALQEELEK